jgi:hypothetical protein
VFGVASENNTIRIGDNLTTTPGESACYVGGIFGQTSAGGTGVFITSNGKLGISTSSGRFKRDIVPMKNSSEALFLLKPVAFHYNKDIDPIGIRQFGLVAEDVESVNPDLIVRDREGKAYSVRYDQVNAMLLNEFLKEHRKVDQMQKQIDELTAVVDKVSARLELNKPAPEVAKSNQ